MNQEFFAKDEIIEFSQKLDIDNFNVKAYRKRKTGNNNRLQPKEIESNEFILSDICDDIKVDKSMQKTQRTTGDLSAKRFSSTAGVRKRSSLNESNHLSFLQTARTKRNSVLDSAIQNQKPQQDVDKIILSSAEEKKIGAFSKQAREIAKKGQLNIKYIKNWLNQVLLEYCSDEDFDLTIENTALKKYGIDKNSLLSKGFNPDNLERIYKSLFVYSMGFNTLLKEVAGKNMNVRKTFWKVYAILLEYCSDGDFQTMIAEIQRDKVKKMESMKKEIQKRQEIIENNEDINKQKNAKIFKELKQLRETNINLQNDKNVLMQDFKEAEQAFNEEVSLRLKFENKINQIHGVHRELSIKHQKLYDDLQIKKEQYSVLKEKMAKLTQNHLILKHQLQSQRKETSLLKQENKLNLEQIEELQKHKMTFQLKEIEWKNKKDELFILIHERDNKISQMRNEIKNLQLMVNLKGESQKELQKEYQRSLSENKQLVLSQQNQLVEINKYMLEKKQFGDTHSKLYAQIDILNRNSIERQKKTQQMKLQYNQLSQNFQQNKIELQTSNHKVLHLTTSLNDCFLKIEQLKKIKNSFEEELMDLRSREEVYHKYYTQKQKVIEQLTTKIQQLQRAAAQFNIVRKTLDSKIAILTQRLISEEQINKKKLQKNKQEITALQNDIKQLKLQAEIKREDATKYTLLYEETFNKLKDQLFERNDLELKYNQSLSVVESENSHIKQLNIKISEYQQKHQDMGRKLKGLEFVMEGKEKTYKMEINNLHNSIRQLKSDIKEKKYYPHPMKYEDLMSQIQRYRTKVSQSNEKDIQTEKIALQAQQKINHLSKELKNTKIICDQKIKSAEQISVQYKKRVEELQQQLKNIQLQKESLKNKRSQGSFKQKERKYLQFIKQKTTRIQELLKQIEKIHDNHNQMIKRVQEAEMKLKQKQTIIEQLQKQKENIEAEKQYIRAQSFNAKKEKERLATKLNDVEQKIKSNSFRQVLVLDPSQKDNNTISRNGERQQLKSREDESREKKIKPGWRNDLASKMRIASNYYKK